MDRLPVSPSLTMASRTPTTLFGVDTRVLILALARMTDSVGNSFLIVVLPLYIASAAISGGTLGLSESVLTGVILSMFGFLNSLGQPFTGRLSDRMGRRKLFVLTGLAFLAVANFAYSLVGTYVSMVFIRGMQGVGAAFTIPATIALVNEYATAENRGGNMGTFNTLRLIGFGAGPVVAGFVVDGGPYHLDGLSITGFDAAFYIAALSAVVSFTLVTLFVSDVEGVEAEASDDITFAAFDREGDHLLDPVFTLGLASLFMAIGIALLATIEPAVNARLDQGPTAFGVQFGAFILAQVLFQAPIGRASDRYGRRLFILLGLSLLAPATLAQGLVVAPWQMVVARFLQGVAGAMVFAPALALAGDLARAGESGSKLSILTMSFGLGTAIGPLASGFLVQFGFVTPFAFGATLAVAGLVLVFTQVEETLKNPERPPVLRRWTGGD